MTNETTENTTNKKTDNKALFGPLGKYAIVAVIMVSIIVTTAIMLDKELNNVEAKIAVIENEVSEMNAVASDSTAAEIDKAVKPAAVADVTVVDTEVVATAEKTANDQEEIEVSEVTQITNEKIAEAATTPTDETATEISTAEATTPAETNRTQRNLEQQQRAEANKLEQKQRMTEMFARINKLEEQQLEQFKASQDKNIVRLREHNTQQQHVIEELISRNNELLEMRKTNLQKHQAKREQALNRI